MNVSLTPELENFVNQKVESGLYQSASEVIRDGLRLLRERDDLHQTKLKELQKEIAIGIQDAEQGKLKPVKETLERVRKKLREQKDKES